MVLPIKDKRNWVFRKRSVLRGLFLLYIAVLLRITVFRSGFTFQNLFQNGALNLTLFQSYTPLIETGNVGRILYLFVGNIIWFVPLGVYLRRFTKREWKIWQIWLFGLLFSFIIEFLQYMFGTGISELDDLILNSLGAWIGAVFGKRKQNEEKGA